MWKFAQHNLDPADAICNDIVREYAHFLKTQGRYVEAENVLRPAILVLSKTEQPGMYRALEDLLASVLMHEGKYEQAKEIQERLLATLEREHYDPRDFAVLDLHYNSACNAALNGHPNDAFVHLDYVASHGMPASVGIAGDPDLKSLYGDRRFKAIVERMQVNERRK